MSDVTVTLGLPAEHRAKAAELYYVAFRQKLYPIFRDEVRARAVLQEGLNGAYAFTAIQDGALVGIAGFKDPSGSLLDIKPAMMTRAFGFLGGWVRILFLLQFIRGLEANTLLMDGIVVDAAARGQGIGSLLLDAVMTYATQQGYHHVRLDVVDTNPRARQLYERKGFVPTKSHHYPFLRHVFGFSGVTTMLKPLTAGG